MRGFGANRFFIAGILFSVLCASSWVIAGAPRPGTPGSVSVPGSDTDGSYTLSWGSTFGGDRYEIRVNSGTSGGYSTANTHINFSGIADGTYRYEIRACTDSWQGFAEECGYYSSAVSIKVQRPPGTPSSLSVPSHDGDGSYSISWGSASGSELTYYLYESKNNGSWTSVYSGSSRSTALSGRGDGSYRYQVKACNPVGGCGGYRSGITLTVLHAPGIPGVIAAPVGVVQVNSYYIAWSNAAGSVARYEYRHSLNNGSYGGWINHGLSKRLDFNSSQSDYEGDHRYQVRACNATGCGSIRSSDNIQVYSIPGVPASITLPSNPAASGYTVTWGSASGTATDYQIRQEYNGTWGSWVSMGQSSFAKTYTLEVGGYVRHQVRACNPAGCSGSRTSAVHLVRKDSTCGELPSGKSGFEMLDIYAGPVGIDAFQVSYRWELDGRVESGPAANNPPTEFLIQQSDNGGSFYDIARVSSTEYTVSNLAPGTYRFRVQGISSYTCASNIVSTGDRVVHGPPPPPSAISFSETSLSCTTSSLTVHWNDSPIGNRYQLQERRRVTAANGTGSWSGWSNVNLPSSTAKSYVSANLQAGVEYQYRVASSYAVSGEQTEWGDWHTGDMIRKPFCAPTPPVGLNSDDYPIDNEGDHILGWQPGTGVISRYELYITGSEEEILDMGLSTSYQPLTALPGGLYRYKVRACNVDACSANFSNVLEIAVMIPVAPPPVPQLVTPPTDPDPAADNGTHYAGILQGELTVSPTGAAAYRLPLMMMPPGTAGVAPKLALEYNSQGGNGLLGLGWSLSGLSMIHRCPQTLAQDRKQHAVDYSSQDRFCLDGQRLVNVAGSYGAPGSQYHTEIDSFDEVTAYGTAGNGPAYFKVRTKSGETLEYGYTSDARIEAQGKTTVEVWALNRVQDTVGNYYEVTYEENSTIGEFYPHRVRYTGHASEGITPYASIDLVYEDRPDQSSAYRLGSLHSQTRRLAKIVTPLGEYRLYYAEQNAVELSRLEQIQYCTANGVDCPATRRLSFAWQVNDGLAGWALSNSNTYRPPLAFADLSKGNFQTWVVDIDGDGRVEIIGGNGDAGNPQLTIKSAPAVNQSTWSDYPGIKPLVTPYILDGDKTKNGGMQVADLNGDGYLDILDGRQRKVWLHGVSKGDGWQISSNFDLPEPFVDYNGKDLGVRIADLNGDGLPDILRASYENLQGDDGETNRVSFQRAWLNTGTGWSAAPAWSGSEAIEFAGELGIDKGGRLIDINGDGLVDLVAALGERFGAVSPKLCLNTGSGWQCRDYTEFPAGLMIVDRKGNDLGLRFTDVNGDGLPDLLKAKSGESDLAEPYQAWLNTGNSWLSSSAYAPRNAFVYGWRDSYGNEHYRDLGTALVDANGDGRVDLIQRYAHAQDFSRAWLNTGAGWLSSNNAYLPPAPIAFYLVDPNVPRDNGVRLADVNADGLTDFMGNNTARLNQAVPSMINSITDGLGNAHTLRYKPLTDPAVYTPGPSGAAPHQRRATPAIYVVHEYDVPDGVDEASTRRFHYENLLVHTQGLGSQGFGRVTQTDMNTGMHTITDYRRVFPYTGLPARVEVKTADEVILQESDIEYNIVYTQGHDKGYVNNGNVLDGTQTDERINVPVFPYPQVTTQTVHHVDNDLNDLYTSVVSVTRNTYDEYGNATEISVEVSGDGHTYKTHTLNQYSPNNPTQQRLGRLTQATVTKTIDGQLDADGNSQRVTRFSYNATTHLLEKETIEPGRGAPKEQVTVYAHDAFGNRIIATVCAADFASCQPGASGPASLPYRSTRTSYDPNNYPAQHGGGQPTYARGRYPVITTNAMGHQESYRYDAKLGSLLRQTGPNGIATCWEYDVYGRKTLERNACGNSEETRIHWRYHLASAHTPNAAYVVVHYTTNSLNQLLLPSARLYHDRLGREVRRMQRGFAGEYIYVDSEYDARGRVLKVSEPYFEHLTYIGDRLWTETEYDDLDRIVKVHHPLGDLDNDGVFDNPATVITQHQGLTTRVTDTRGRTQVTEKDALGRTVAVTEAAGTVDQTYLEHHYDVQDNLLRTRIDQRPETDIVMHYDIRGRKEDLSDPDMGVWRYEYNGFGELTQQTDAKGQVTRMTYDVLGRLRSRTFLYGNPLPQTSTWDYHDNPGSSPVGSLGKLKQTSGPSNTPQSSLKTQHYNALGRLIQTREYVDLQWHQVDQSYDTLGRLQLRTYPTAHGERVQMRSHYNPYGYLWYLTDTRNTPDSADDEVYWVAEQVNARGQLEVETHRNRTQTTRLYNAATGWLDTTFTLDATGDADNLIQYTHYRYDASGNVLSKTDRRQGANPYVEGLTEVYDYDDLDRLTATRIQGGAPGIAYRDKTYTYDHLGNLTQKSDVGNYFYGSDCSNGGFGLHALCEIRDTDGTTLRQYIYDANGNLTEGGGRRMHYSPDNLPTFIEDQTQGTQATFHYGADRTRILRIADERIQQSDHSYQLRRERIAYVGLSATGRALYEQKTHEASNAKEHIYFIYAGDYHGGHAFAMRVMEEDADGAVQYHGTEYFHRDPQWSVLAISDDSGLLHDDINGELRAFTKNYDAWGKRRNDDWSEDPHGATQYTTVRGHLAYTGQESITGVGLIHMNGRVYDPELGKFISADPHVQFSQDSQSYNRYSYARNNPTRYTDPSGYFINSLMRRISPSAATFIGIVLNAVNAYVPGLGTALSMMFNSMWASANGASVRDLGRSMAFSLVAYGVGGAIAGNWFNEGTFGYTLMQGAIGGGILGATNASASGGNVARGFFQGAAQGAAMAAVVWGVQNSVSSRTTQGSKLDRETLQALNRGKISGVDTERLNTTNLDVDVTTSKGKDGITIKTIKISGTYEDSTRFGSDIEKIIEGQWKGEFFDATTNTRYIISTDINPLGSDLGSLLKGPSFKIGPGSCQGVSNYACGGRAGITIEGGNKGVHRFMSDPDAVGHEFGHVLGFNHFPEGSGNIMSYDMPASLQIGNAQLLDKYYGQ